jgi:hypothetical protein
MVFHIYLNSKYATQVDNVYKLQDSISILKKENKPIEFAIKSIILPLSFYSTNSNNNKLVLSSYPGSVSSEEITITPGNYNIVELVSELEDKLQAVEANFSVSYNSVTYKITISNSTGNFVVDYTNSTCGEFLGLPETGESDESDNLTFENVYNMLNTCDTIMICVNGDFTYVDRKYTNFKKSKNYVIDILKNPGMNEIYEFNYSDSNILYKFRSENLGDLNFYFTDSLGNILDLNGKNFILKLVICN